MFTEPFYVTNNNEDKLYFFEHAYKNGNLDMITNTNKHMGTVVMPTGYGKSSQMFGDAIHHIENCDGKIVIIFAGPILRLVAQTQNDFHCSLGKICKDLCERKGVKFFINSSANSKEYKLEDINSDAYYISDFEDVFVKNKNAKVALIASCYDSLPKVAKKIEQIKKSAELCVYLDESHLAISSVRDERDFETSTSDGKERYNGLETLCKESDYLYAVSATPDKYVTEMINKIAYKRFCDADFATESYQYHIVDVKPNEAIHDNIILPFNIKMAGITAGSEIKISPEMCAEFMRTVHQNDTNKVPHKILVTCQNSKNLISLRTALKDMGFKVFSTCAKEGSKYNDKDEAKDIDPIKFIEEVDSCNEDCFVLHIRQLRQGIDIKTLTDTIIYNNTKVNDGVKKILIQTIGRVLRTLSSERGKCEDERKKKYSNILFVLEDGNLCYEIASEMENLLIKYYGRDGIRSFTCDHNVSGSLKGLTKVMKEKYGEDYDGDINVLEVIVDAWKISMKEYVETNLKPKVNKMKEMCFKNIYNNAVNEMENKFYHYSGEYDTSELFSDTEFMAFITDLFNKYGIE